MEFKVVNETSGDIEILVPHFWTYAGTYSRFFDAAITHILEIDPDYSVLIENNEDNARSLGGSSVCILLSKLMLSFL